MQMRAKTRVKKSGSMYITAPPGRFRAADHANNDERLGFRCSCACASAPANRRYPDLDLTTNRLID